MVTVASGGLGSIVLAGALGGAAAGLSGALLNGANFGQALKATFTGGVWGAAGSFLAFAGGGGPFLERLFKHSFSQAWLEGIRGGNMKHGLMAGLASVAGGEAIMQYAGNTGKAVKVALNSVVAGTASELGGGKFANGAMTGAFIMLYNDLMHQEEEKAGSGGDVPQTGDKFYSESGQLLWDSNSEGDPNRVFIIPEGKVKYFNSKMHMYDSWVGPESHKLAYGREIGTEYNILILGNDLYIYPQRSFKDLIAATHFFMEGFGAGYMKGQNYFKNTGLSNHYSQQPTAESQWRNYYTPKQINPWWQ